MTMSIQAVIGFLPKVLIEYEPEGCISDDILNVIRTETESGRFTQFSSDFAFRLDNPLMARGGVAPEVNFSENQVPYLASPHALKGALDFAMGSLNPIQFNRTMHMAKTLVRKLALWQENETITLMNTFTSAAVATPWWTAGGGFNSATNPIDDIMTAYRALAMPPNSMIMGKRVWDKFRNHPNVLGQRPVLRAGSLNPAEVKEILGVENFYVPEVKYNSNGNRGKAQVLSYLWPDSVFLFHKNPEEEIGTEAITWAAKIRVEAPDVIDAPHTTSVQYMASDQGTSVRMWEDPNRGEEGTAMLQVYRKYQLAKIAGDLGYQLTTVLA